MKESDFFYYLLTKTKEVYSNSEIKEKNWYYSISSTKLIKGAPLIVGFNWGVEKKCNHEPQKKYPQKSFIEMYDELGSMKRTVPYFRDYFKEALEGVQTNFCFFRSEHENQISPSDLEKSIPLFEELVSYLRPTMIISFSSRLRDFLIQGEKLHITKEMTLLTSRNEISIVKGKYICDNDEVGFSYLPHPNYPLKKELRNAAWEFMF